MGPTKQQAVWRRRVSLNLRRNSHNSKHFIAVIKDILRCLWGHLGIHFIHLNRACELGWSEPTVEAAHVSPSPPHTLFCLSLVCCIVARAHSAGRLVCMLSLIIASGKTTFLCKTECIADCMCCDNRQTGRRTQTPSPLMQTLAFPLTAEPAEQLPNLAGQNFVNIVFLMDFIRLQWMGRRCLLKWIDRIDSSSSGPTNRRAHMPVWDWAHRRGLSHQTQQTTSDKKKKNTSDCQMWSSWFPKGLNMKSY